MSAAQDKAQAPLAERKAAEYPWLNLSAVEAKLSKTGRSIEDLEFRDATPDDMEVHSRNNWNEWGDQLTQKQYEEREHTLRDTKAALNGGQQGWVLSWKGTPDDHLAACETIRHKAVVAKGGEIEDALCHCIGTVFSGEQHKGKGYGLTMMRLLAQKLKEWKGKGAGVPEDIKNLPVRFSYMFSDIGDKYYSKNGWIPMDDRLYLQIIIPSPGKGNYEGNVPPLPDEVKKTLGRTVETEDIVVDFDYNAERNLHEVEELCAHDERLLKDRLKKKSAIGGEDEGKTLVAVVPTPEIFTWFWTREQWTTDLFREAKSEQLKHAASKAFAGEKAPSVRGAFVSLRGNDSQGKSLRLGWMFWSRMYYENKDKKPSNTLYILRVVFDDDAIAIALENTDILEVLKGEQILPEGKDPVGAGQSGSTNKADLSDPSVSLLQDQAGLPQPPTEPAGKLRALIARLLLEKAYKQASEWRMDRIEMWRPEPALVQAATTLGATVIKSNKGTMDAGIFDLPSLNWYGNETEGMVEGIKRGENVEEIIHRFKRAMKNMIWYDGQKYCWN